MMASRKSIARITGTSTIALVALLFTVGCRNRTGETDANKGEQAKKTPPEVSVEDGQTVLTLDSAKQNRAGLEIETLTATVSREQISAPAVVLPAQDLTAFRNGYLAAQSQLQKSRIEAGVARKEYLRLKSLFDQEQNVSEKALQSAEGTLETSEANVRAVEQQLSLQESVVRQEWGSAVSKWAVEGSAELQRVFDQRDLLVQLTLPANTSFGPPPTISIEIPGSSREEARFVSPIPKVDPRIQGKSFVYLAPAHSGLSPGVNLVAHLSNGNPMRGVTVPTAAVVWSEGRAWVYRQTAANRFTRLAVATDMPVEKGFFVHSGLSAGDKVVSQGAQTLLSEELLVRGQSGGETDE